MLRFPHSVSPFC